MVSFLCEPDRDFGYFLISEEPFNIQALEKAKWYKVEHNHLKGKRVFCAVTMERIHWLTIRKDRASVLLESRETKPHFAGYKELPAPRKFPASWGLQAGKVLGTLVVADVRNATLRSMSLPNEEDWSDPCMVRLRDSMLTVEFTTAKTISTYGLFPTQPIIRESGELPFFFEESVALAELPPCQKKRATFADHQTPIRDEFTGSVERLVETSAVERPCGPDVQRFVEQVTRMVVAIEGNGHLNPPIPKEELEQLIIPVFDLYGYYDLVTVLRRLNPRSQGFYVVDRAIRIMST